ncbi:MAG: hypothetical protein ABSD97_07145 [Acidimicrobiales bacterium]
MCQERFDISFNLGNWRAEAQRCAPRADELAAPTSTVAGYHTVLTEGLLGPPLGGDPFACQERARFGRRPVLQTRRASCARRARRYAL